MAWIESHQSLGRHPRMLRLAARVRACGPQVIGHLHYLWWWALDYAPDGDVSRFAAQEIAAASEWKGDPDLWLAALNETGWIDPDGHLHDWKDGRVRSNRRRELGRDRQERWRQRQRDSPNPDNAGVTRYVTRHGSVSNAPSVEYSREKKSGERETAHDGPDGESSEEAPPGFPRTEVEAVESGALHGASAEFAKKLWHLAVSRGWRDSKGILIRNWSSYLAASQAFAEEDRRRQRRGPEPNGHVRPRGPENGQTGETLRAPRL